MVVMTGQGDFLRSGLPTALSRYNLSVSTLASVPL